MKRSLCPEVLAFACLMQKQIDNNNHLDRKNVRGWKERPEGTLMFEVHDELNDLSNAIEHLQRPPGGDPRGIPSPEFIAKQAADVACHVMFIADTSGGIDTIDNIPENIQALIDEYDG